jgi:membrane fusion protein (multidrug efflux system)
VAVSPDFLGTGHPARELNLIMVIPIRSTTSLVFGVALAALSSLFLGGCGQGTGKQTNREGSGRSNALSVEAVVIRPQVLDNKIFTTGTLLANEEVVLRPEVSGRVIGVFFQEGSRIAKGTLMLKIDDRELQAQHKRKKLEEKQASDEESRKRSLYDIKAISQEEYDKTLNTLRMIQADKEVIESQIGKTEIRAPFNGVVGLRYVSEGGFVSPNMLAATMQELDPMKVEFSVPEKYAKEIKSGIEILVRAGDSEKDHKGVIYALETKIDPNTRTIKARGKIPNADGTMIPGAFAKVEITLAKLSDAIVIPSGAVIPELNGEKVFICINGKAKQVFIKTGIRTEKNIQIVSGLAANDTLIVTGLLQLSDGKDVQIKTLQGN